MKKKHKQTTNEWRNRFIILSIIALVVMVGIFTRAAIKQFDWNEYDAELDLNLSAPELMDLMEESNIKIYGHYECIWCIRQIISFNKTFEAELALQQNVSVQEILPTLWKQEVVTRGLFVDCGSAENIEECSEVGVTSTPAWAKDGEIFRTGFVPIK